MYRDFFSALRIGRLGDGPGRSSRAERGTPRSYVKPRSCAARRVHLFSPCARAPDDSHTSARAVQQERCCVEREPRTRAARSRDRRCQLAFSDNFHPSKGARRGRSLRFFSTFLCSFPRALSLSRDPLLRRGGLASSIEDEKDRRRRSAPGRPGFARTPVIKSRAIVLRAVFFFPR